MRDTGHWILVVTLAFCIHARAVPDEAPFSDAEALEVAESVVTTSLRVHLTGRVRAALTPSLEGTSFASHVRDAVARAAWAKHIQVRAEQALNAVGDLAQPLIDAGGVAIPELNLSAEEDRLWARSLAETLGDFCRRTPASAFYEPLHLRHYLERPRVLLPLDTATAYVVKRWLEILQRDFNSTWRQRIYAHAQAQRDALQTHVFRETAHWQRWLEIPRTHLDILSALHHEVHLSRPQRILFASLKRVGIKSPQEAVKIRNSAERHFFFELGTAWGEPGCYLTEVMLPYLRNNGVSAADQTTDWISWVDNSSIPFIPNHPANHLLFREALTLATAPREVIRCVRRFCRGGRALDETDRPVLDSALERFAAEAGETDWEELLYALPGDEWYELRAAVLSKALAKKRIGAEPLERLLHAMEPSRPNWQTETSIAEVLIANLPTLLLADPDAVWDEAAPAKLSARAVHAVKRRIPTGLVHREALLEFLVRNSRDEAEARRWVRGDSFGAKTALLAQTRGWDLKSSGWDMCRHHLRETGVKALEALARGRAKLANLRRGTHF